jgi:hypothetical protein
VKRLLLCLLLPFYIYTSDATHEEVQRDRFATGPKINVLQPKDFNDTGKRVLMNWVGNCLSVAHVGGVSTDSGLAKIFLGMYQDDADKIINDPATLNRANEYNNAYQLSKTAIKIEWLTRQEIAPGVNGDHTAPFAKEAFTLLIHGFRAYEFYDIMNKQEKGALMVPDGNFMLWYKDSNDPINTPKAFIEFLKQNTEASAYLVPAIRGISILAAYYLQQSFS